MSDFTLKYILAFLIVVLLLVLGVLFQNWRDERAK